MFDTEVPLRIVRYLKIICMRIMVEFPNHTKIMKESFLELDDCEKILKHYKEIGLEMKGNPNEPKWKKNSTAAKQVNQHQCERFQHELPLKIEEETEAKGIETNLENGMAVPLEFKSLAEERVEDTRPEPTAPPLHFAPPFVQTTAPPSNSSHAPHYTPATSAPGAPDGDDSSSSSSDSSESSHSCRRHNRRKKGWVNKKKKKKKARKYYDTSSDSDSDSSLMNDKTYRTT